MATLVLTALGGFEARLSARPLPALPKKAQACLAYLALESTSVHSRAELAALLWGDTGDAQAHQSLRKALSSIRSALGDEAESILLAQEGSVALAAAQIDVDAIRFERLAAEGTPEAAARAAALYRGHLLHGFDLDEGPFNDWLLVTRERLRELALRTMSRLLAHQMAGGSFDPAAETANRILQLEPLHEPAHRALMQLYAAHGRRVDAVRQYRLCADALRRELNVTPDAETEALYRKIATAASTPAPLRSAERTASPEEPSHEPAQAIANVTSSREPAQARHSRRLTAAAAGAIAITVGALAMPWSREILTPRATGEPVSLAVLPLANVAADDSQDYLAEGLTEALIHDLAQIRALRVISRTSVMRYRNAHIPLGSIARELGADLVLEGSLQQSGDRVRITLQLVEAASDHHVWSRSFDTIADQLFDTQREIARRVAREVSVQVSPAEEARLAAKRRVDPEAYRSYLLGRHFWNRRTAEALRTAVGHLERAVEIDPEFAPAHAALAQAQVLLGDELYAVTGTREASLLAHASAARALALDPDLAEAHAARALALAQFDWDWRGAEEAFRLALDANPGSATTHQWYGWFLVARSRADEAIEAMERARNLDPLSLTVTVSTGHAYYFARRYDEAMAQYDAALELDPHYGGAHLGRGWVLERLGRLKEAREAYTLAARNAPGPSYEIAVARMEAALGDAAGARARLADLKARGVYVPAVLCAQLNFALKDLDAAFADLSRAVDERSSTLLYMLVNPSMDSIRSDPRWGALVRQVTPDS